ncbi:hypothetical protein FB567DRAFT_519051 [Paraphoma chrysanthemicola]|uniref:Uncharacterized protein n=1 Tax=Paraphoma chrysanthemicola TaxID=798071 RepID=A0A8K0RAT7_9PLEO|nr:hypothetical protein FB567DRAFT_519051 [Paraphoma chrysanthemicola]
MRVPLEILRIILDYLVQLCSDRMSLTQLAEANETSTYHAIRIVRSLLLRLRLVNKLFDEEILHLIFPRKRDMNPLDFLWKKNWKSAPHSLQQRYLFRRVTHPNTMRGLWTELAVPVFERQLTSLGISQFSHAAREEKLRQWCALVTMHHEFEIHWVVMDWCWADVPSTRELKLFLPNTKYAQELNCITSESNGENNIDLQIENNMRFLDILCAIRDDDEDTVLNAFPDSCIGVDDLNFCFGTTLIGFAIANGSLNMLKLLLRSIKTVNRKYLYVYLRLASARGADGQVFVDSLLDKISGTHAAKKTLAIDLLAATGAKSYALFDITIRWMVGIHNFQSQLQVLEWGFEHLLKEDLKKYRHTNLTSKKDNSLFEPRLLKTCLNYPAPALTPASVNIARPDYGDWSDKTTLTNLVERCLHTTLKDEFMLDGWKILCASGANSLAPLFTAVALDLLHWADWLLWAGADARHLEHEIGILDIARELGKEQEVAEMVRKRGWDTGKLEVVLP